MTVNFRRVDCIFYHFYNGKCGNENRYPHRCMTFANEYTLRDLNNWKTTLEPCSLSPHRMNNHVKDLIRAEWELLKKLSTTKFLTATSGGLCSTIVSSEVCLKETGIKCVELIELGAIYVKSAYDSKPKRILSDVYVSEGDLIRVHPYPRRYKTIDDIDWRCATIHDSADYVIIHKPAGVPSNPTLDNYYENVFVRAKSEMKYEGTLYLPHRLDTDTSGLLLLGKSKKFASYFGSLLKLRQNVTKKYKAIVASTSSNTINDVLIRINKENVDRSKADVHQNVKRVDVLYPRGLLITNYLEKNSRTPKKFSETPTEESLLCQLILSSNSQPLTLSVFEWRKWSEKVMSSPKYDQVVRDKFSDGFNTWLHINQSESSVSSSTLPQHLHIEDENKRLLTFWDVDIQLLTGMCLVSYLTSLSV